MTTKYRYEYECVNCNGDGSFRQIPDGETIEYAEFDLAAGIHGNKAMCSQCGSLLHVTYRDDGVVAG